MATSRPSVPRSVQVDVYYRERWLCHLCRRPVVFPLTFKLLSELVESELPDVPVALFNQNWRRDKAPLLDELGACVDHVEAYATGGAHNVSNFATACGRCNARKSARTKDEYLEAASPWKVKGQHGEPEDWDGMASLFVVLARRSKRPLTVAERDWLRAFEDHYEATRAR